MEIMETRRIKAQKKPETKEQRRAKIQFMLESGISTMEIAKELGVSVSTVASIKKKEDL